MKSRRSHKLLASLLSAVIALPVLMAPAGTVLAASAASVSCQFTGSQKDQAGYAEGTITLSATADGTYKLYWANNTKALEGYYPIRDHNEDYKQDPNEGYTLKAGQSKSIQLGYHSVIPKGATKIIATTGSLNVADAAAVYSIPSTKRLSSASGKLLYTFSTYSDIHMDTRDPNSIFWVNSKSNFRKALSLSAQKEVDYIVVSGDCITCSNPDDEWDKYLSILSESDYVNPIWESTGNHELKVDKNNISTGLSKFVKATGTDGSSSSKSYFSKTEEKTGDLFIFMALDKSKDPNQAEIFSGTQMTWVKNLIAQNYSSRNIFLVEHAPVRGYCAGDRLDPPYYPGLMDPSYGNNGEFKKLLQDYPNIVFLSGHTHEDLTMDYNYFNDNGNAANMIHTPALGGSTVPDPNNPSKLTYSDGTGINCQAYYVQVFENEIVFNGMNITENKIYPAYSYIMEGGRTSSSAVQTPASTRPLKNVTVSITDTLVNVSGILTKYDKYASYDSYQALKKYYYQYKNQTTADESVVDEFNARITALSAYTGSITIPILYDKYYFVNNYGWSSVYAYAWDGNSHNAEWPGVKLSTSGTNSQGQDIYEIAFSSRGQYKYLIFNNGSNAKQTVDIPLTDYQYNGFYISGTDNGKYKVTNFSMDAPTTERQLVLLYYVKDEHGWDQKDLSLRLDTDGLYKAVYHPTSDKNFSCSIYDSDAKKYYSLSESADYTFAANQSFTDTLTRMSSRGKSVTVRGLSDQYLLAFEFDPSTNKLTTRCQYYVTEPLVNTSSVSAESVRYGSSVTLKASATGGTNDYTYAFMYRPTNEEEWTKFQDFSTNDTASFKPSAKGTFNLCTMVKDGTGTIAYKTFTLTVFASLKNTSTAPTSVAYQDSITVKAKATGGLGSYQFAIYYKRAENTDWVQKQGFSSNSTVTIKPAKATAYDICVKVRDSRNVVVKKYLQVAVTVPTNTSKLSASTVTLGSNFVVKCSAKNGAGGYRYQVHYKRSSADNWVIAQYYSTNATVSVKPQKATTYNFCVRVKDANGNVTKKYFNGKVTSA